MRQDIISKLAALVAYLQAQEVSPVYVGAVPASVKGAFCVLSDASEDFVQEDLKATDGSNTEWTLTVYGSTPEVMTPLIQKAWTALNRPGDVFNMGGYRAAYCRCASDSFTTELDSDGAEETRISYEMNVTITLYN